MDVNTFEQLAAVKANCQGQADYCSPAGGEGPVQPPNSKLYHAKATTDPKGGASPPPPRRGLLPKDLFESAAAANHKSALHAAAHSDLQTGLLPFAEARAAVSGATDSATVQGPLAKRAKTNHSSTYYSDEEAGEEAVSRLRSATSPAAGGTPAGAVSQSLLLAHLNSWGVVHGVGLMPAQQGLGRVAEEWQGEREQEPGSGYSQGLREEGDASDAELSDHSQEECAFQAEYFPAPYPGDMDAEE